MKALVPPLVPLVVVVAVAAGAGCPFLPPCTGDANTVLVIAGEKCGGCTLDFGDVEVPLQEHRRIDVVQGCEEDFLDSPQLSGDPSFTLSNFQFPPQPGGTGFAEISFTANEEGTVSAVLTLPTSGGSLDADLRANGVP